MKPISNIRTLIESSNLQYLHPKIRRNVIENSTHWEICSINKKVSDIFLWEDFLKSHYHTGDSYTNMLLSSKFFDTSKDIMEILMNPEIERIFYFPTDYFTWLMSLCTNKADFIDMCHLPIVRNTIFPARHDVLHTLLPIFHSLRELKDISQNIDFQYIVTYWKIENITYLIDLLKISDYSKLAFIMQYPQWEHIKKILKNGYPQDLHKILSKKVWENSIIITDKSIQFFKEAKIWSCKQNESKNERILEWNLHDSFYQVSLKGQVVWYIKKVWEKSLLAVKDVYGKDGVLLLMKWMIYAVQDVSNISWSVNLDLREELKVNPIRMIRLSNFDLLVETFLKNSNFK